MAKKKKKIHKKTFYKRYILLGLAGAACLLGIYCFYFSKPSQPIRVRGHQYPIKTPGPAVKKEEYEVYEKMMRAANQQSQEQLLPEQETPDIQKETPAPSPLDATPPLDMPPPPVTTVTSPSSAPAPHPTSKSVSLQVGLIYISLAQAEKGLASLKKIAPWPSSLKAVVQKATYKNQVIYRLVLSGSCPVESLSFYQKTLTQKRIPYALLSPQ